MNKQYGAIVHTTIPFDNQLKLDENAYRGHLRRLGEAGLSVYIGAAGAGEGNTLTREERDRVLAIGVEELKGKVVVRAAGTEPRDTREMVEFLKSAEALKVDAAQIYSMDMGHGVLPNRKEIEHFFRTSIEATSLPVTISNQKKVGYPIPMDFVEDLAKRYPNFAGYAYDVSDMFYMMELLRRFGDRLEIYASGVGNAMFALGMGACGFQGMEGNIAPKLFASVVTGFVNKDIALMHESFRKVMRLHAILKNPVRENQRAIKPVLNAYGLGGGQIRPPRIAISGQELEDVIAAIEALEIPEMASWKRQQ